MKKVLAFLRKNPETIFFICAFILWTAFMCYENAKEGGDFKWHDLKVEANGMIFDLFVFGILVSIYNAIVARKEKIERLKEEIDDYRLWHEKEAMYRTIGAIKRLNILGVSKINLRKCFLLNAELVEGNLQGADLTEANLQGVSFQGANLRNVEMPQADLQGGNFQRSDLQDANLMVSKAQGADFQFSLLKGANFWGANLSTANLQNSNLSEVLLRSATLQNVNLRGANLEDSDLSLADLQDANLQGANLQGANLHGANFQGANLLGVNLQGATLQSIDYQHGKLGAPYPYTASLQAEEIGRVWFDALDEWGVVGSLEIRKNYQFDQRGRLQKK